MPSNTNEALKARATARIDEERPALLDLSARIHAHPELCFAEHRAAGWLTEYLESRGFALERGAFGLPTAFAARRGMCTRHRAIDAWTERNPRQSLSNRCR